MLSAPSVIAEAYQIDAGKEEPIYIEPRHTTIPVQR
jgi:hypothetical protein